MNPARLLGFLSLAYIIWWFYALLTAIIPMASVDWAQLTLWSIIAVILFFTLGIAILLTSFIVTAIFFLTD